MVTGRAVPPAASATQTSPRELKATSLPSGETSGVRAKRTGSGLLAGRGAAVQQANRAASRVVWRRTMAAYPDERGREGGPLPVVRGEGNRCRGRRIILTKPTGASCNLSVTGRVGHCKS